MKTKLLLSLSALLISVTINAQTSFAALQNIDSNTGNEPYRIASGDLDGDNIIDLVMATYDYYGSIDYIKWYKNDGDGNFSIPTSTEVSSTLRLIDGLAIADIDGQFGNDIIASSALQGKLVYFPSDGSGGFGTEVVISSTIAGAGALVTDDINMDGNIDIALVAYDADKVMWFSGNGNGGFTSQTDIDGGNSNGPLTIDIGDFDGDSDLDILVGYYVGGFIEIYYNQYIESGSTAVSWIKDTVTVDSGSNYLFDTIFADVNNDGTMDVVGLDIGSDVVKWYEKDINGTSTAFTIADNSIITRHAAIAVADVDNDNINDVIISSEGGYTVGDSDFYWFKGAANDIPSITPSEVGNVSRGIYSMVIEDFDYDGYNDIAFVNNIDDRVDWYENEWDVLGVSDNELSSINIYPNPAKDILNIQSSNNEYLNISIYNVLGIEIITTSLNSNNSIDISGLQSGMYFVKLEGISETHKFLKE